MNKNDEYQIDLVKLFGSLLDHKWLIACITLAFSLLGGAYSLLVTPIYTANATIQIEKNSTASIFKDFTSILDQQSYVQTEISILKSRLVLEKTVQELNLTTQISAIYPIPFISKALERLFGDYSDISIAEFEPTNEAFEQLVLEIAPEENQYSLFSDTGELLLKGMINHKYSNNNFTIQVSKLKGSIGKKFRISKISHLLSIQKLQKNLLVSEKGKQTGVIEISLNGENKNQIKQIVKSVSDNYISQNILRSSEDASKSLDFLQNRLPEIRENLANSENTLNEYRQKNSSIDLSLETKSYLDTLVRLDTDLNVLLSKESEISQKFTKRHPTYISLLEQKRVLLREKEKISRQISDLPDTQKEILRLSRDLEIEQQIYIQLLKKMQELDVIKAGIIGNARVLDIAQVMPDIVFPNKMLIVALSTLLGIVFSFAFVMLKMLFRRTIESVDEIQEQIGLVVYGTIPFSREQIEVSVDKIYKRSAYPLLSDFNPADLSIEALRSLRTSIHFAMMETNNNIIAFSGSSPSVGKSFISVNFSNIAAKAGQKVLLIDMDLRRSYIHKLLGLEESPGISDILTNHIDFKEAIITKSNLSFDILTKGTSVKNPAEILSSKRVQDLFQWASKNYDLVIIDTPPILAVTDAAIIGNYVSMVFLIGRYEQTTLREVKLSKEIFEKSGVFVKGFILNGIKRKASNRYDYYQYDYTS